MPLRPHDSLGNPEILPPKPPDIIQPESCLMRCKRLLLPAPDRVIIVSCHVQIPRHLRIIDMLIKPTARKVMQNHGSRDNFPNQPDLEIGEIHNTLTAETLPVQAERRIVRGNRLCGQRNLLKAVILLRPEGSAVGFI